MKYEYRNHTIVFTDPDRMTELNRLGEQGWQIVFVEPYEPQHRNYTGALMMRVKPVSQPIKQEKP